VQEGINAGMTGQVPAQVQSAAAPSKIILDT